MDLLALPAPDFMAVLTTMWMDWNLRDEDTGKARTRLIRILTDAATPVQEEQLTDAEGANPFPNVMRSGPMGSIGR